MSIEAPRPGGGPTLDGEVAPRFGDGSTLDGEVAPRPGDGPTLEGEVAPRPGSGPTLEGEVAPRSMDGPTLEGEVAPRSGDGPTLEGEVTQRPGSGPTLCPLAPAHLAGLGAIQLAVILAFLRLELAAIPLLLFVVACGAASLMPRSRFFLPVRSRGRTGRSVVALTFDDGPDPATTPRLLGLLASHGVQATFFIPGNRADEHPELVGEILERGHEVGNHSYSHDPLLMLRRPGTLAEEVGRGQEALGRCGVTPLVFRPPVGVTNPLLWRVLLRRGLTCVTFSNRAGDFGNRRIKGLAARILARARPDDIIMLHDVMPKGGRKSGRKGGRKGGRKSGMNVEVWLGEMEAILVGLKARGLAVEPLATLLGQPVTARPKDPKAGQPLTSGSTTEVARHPAAAFYDGLAPTYDAEQRSAGASLVRRVEDSVVRARLPALVTLADRVLELGSGTGQFTLDLARSSEEVVAVDLSEGMLSVLAEKARQANLAKIRCVQGDITALLGTPPDPRLQGPFDVICCFSAFEYIPDLAAHLKGLTSRLRPGGHIYYTTAHRGPFRLFTQIGNAMRQGLWLHARGRRETHRMLKAAGLEQEILETHVFRLPLLGGMLLEVLARRR